MYGCSFRQYSIGFYCIYTFLTVAVPPFARTFLINLSFSAIVTFPDFKLNLPVTTYIGFFAGCLLVDVFRVDLLVVVVLFLAGIISPI